MSVPVQIGEIHFLFVIKVIFESTELIPTFTKDKNLARYRVLSLRQCLVFINM